MSRHFGLPCPTDPAHGSLYPLQVATANGEGWYCSHRDHDGYKTSAGSRPFFTTAEVEAASEVRTTPQTPRGERDDPFPPRFPPAA